MRSSKLQQLRGTWSGYIRPVDLTDVVTVGNLLAAFKDHPETIELNMHDVGACKRMKIDSRELRAAHRRSDQEIETLRQAWRP